MLKEDIFVGIKKSNSVNNNEKCFYKNIVLHPNSVNLDRTPRGGIYTQMNTFYEGNIVLTYIYLQSQCLAWYSREGICMIEGYRR